MLTKPFCHKTLYQWPNSSHIKHDPNLTMATVLFNDRGKIHDGRQIQDGRRCTNRLIFVNT